LKKTPQRVYGPRKGIRINTLTHNVCYIDIAHSIFPKSSIVMNTWRVREGRTCTALWANRSDLRKYSKVAGALGATEFAAVYVEKHIPFQTELGTKYGVKFHGEETSSETSKIDAQPECSLV
jgi:hypothetical protein